MALMAGMMVTWLQKIEKFSIPSAFPPRIRGQSDQDADDDQTQVHEGTLPPAAAAKARETHAEYRKHKVRNTNGSRTGRSKISGS
jgi:hypothetical protein